MYLQIKHIKHCLLVWASFTLILMKKMNSSEKEILKWSLFKATRYKPIKVFKDFIICIGSNNDKQIINHYKQSSDENIEIEEGKF